MARMAKGAMRRDNPRLPWNSLDSTDLHMLRSLHGATGTGTKGTDLYGLVLEMGGFPYLSARGIRVRDVVSRSSRLAELGLVKGSLRDGSLHIDVNSIDIYPEPRPAGTFHEPHYDESIGNP